MAEIQQQQRSPFGAQLREWRHRRRMSQLDFALDAEISQKHLSFIETGRSVPSRDMVVRLAEALDVPLRDRNAMLVAAGYAPLYAARDLGDRSLAPARAAIDLLLRGHEPFPALAIDRHWTMLSANGAARALLALVSEPTLLSPPINVLRLTLHPQGLAPAIVNFGEWRRHLLDRLKRQIRASADPDLVMLLGELEAYPGETAAPGPARDDPDFADIFVPLRLVEAGRQLSFFSTTTVFGTPVDVTLAEIAIESFFPADEATRDALVGQSG